MFDNPSPRTILLLLGALLPATAAADSGSVADQPGEQPRISIELDETGDAPGQPEDFELDRFEARATYEAHFENKQYDEAADAAEVALELTEAEVGPASMELVPILNALGTSLVNAGRPAEALPRFQRSVQIIEEREGIFARELVGPLYGMGVAFQQMGEHAEAIDNLQRAQHVTHRLDGVVNPDQIPVIQAITRSLMAEEKWTEAENLQLLTYKIQRRQYGEESLASLPAMFELAEWYQETRDFRQAREIYERGLDLLEEADLENTPEALPALRGIARSYQRGRLEGRGRGLEAQQRIVQIIREHPEDIPVVDRAEAFLELGDWYLLSNDSEDAWEAYREGWALATSEAAAEDRDWRAYFDRPHLIHPGADLSIEVLENMAGGRDVYFDFEFTIGRNGRPQDIVITDANLQGQVRSAAVQAFRYARFRPPIEDGETVAVDGYRIRRVFPTSYQPEKLDGATVVGSSGVRLNR